jgi:hypothetical protein
MLVTLATLLGHFQTAQAAVTAVASPDPTYCPLLASTCWESSTCPAATCEKDSEAPFDCTPKGWEATHENAMKYMDDKLKNSASSTTYASCKAKTIQSTCDADSNCVWLTADLYTTDYGTGGKLYDANSCAVIPSVAYTELDKDSAVPSGMLAYWYLEFHWSAVCRVRTSGNCEADKQCTLTLGTCHTSDAYWWATAADDCPSQDFTPVAKNYGFTDIADAFTKGGVTMGSCDDMLKFIKEESVDCTAVDGKCPATCEQLLTHTSKFCDGKKFTHKSNRLLEPDLGVVDFNAESVIWLIDWQYDRNGLKDDACNEVIHEFQINSIETCNEAFHNVEVDTLSGYYCSTPQSSSTVCHKYCQESITKFDEMCKGTDNKFKYTGLDGKTVDTPYSAAEMSNQITLTDATACDFKYTGPTSGAASIAPSSIALAASVMAAIALLL